MKIYIIITALVLSFLSVKTKVNAQCFYNNNVNSANSKLQSSGNAKLDLFLTSNLRNLAYPWGYNIDFGFYKGFNGQAVPYNFGGFDGKILLGKELMTFEYSKRGLAYNQPMGEYFAYAVLAHEFAHIIQFNHRELLFQDVVTQEIHADMIAGYLLAKYIHKKSGLESKIDVRYSSSECGKIMTELKINFGRLGDNSYWAPNHHGNYSTRQLAINEGMEIYFKVGPRLIWKNDRLIEDPNWSEMADFEHWLLQASNGYSYGIQMAENLIRKYDN